MPKSERETSDRSEQCQLDCFFPFLRKQKDLLSAKMALKLRPGLVSHIVELLHAPCYLSREA